MTPTDKYADHEFEPDFRRPLCCLICGDCEAAHEKPKDKYAEHAREMHNTAHNWYSANCEACNAIARALEQAALEARIDELDADWGGADGMKRKRLEELRARLAELRSEPQ